MQDRDGLVLEAGCGAGEVAAALHHRGFAVHAVDYEANTVRELRDRFPMIDATCGDVRDLPMESGSVTYYLSIGVLEHMQDGSEEAILEARRVLRSGGRAFISVPYLNPFRQAFLDRCLSGGHCEAAPLFFHQYYFSTNEFSRILESNGLMVLDAYPYACAAFLTREVPVLSRVWRSRLVRARLRRWGSARCANAGPDFRRRFGHMVMFVCVKQ